MLSFVIAEEGPRIETSYPFNEVTAVFLLNNSRYRYCLPVCISVCTVHMSVCVSICLYMPVCLAVCTCVCLSVRLSVCLSVCPLCSRLNYFDASQVVLTTPELVQLVKHHYTQQVLLKLYKVVFNLNVIGNPVGLLGGLASGVADLFYEPFQGIMVGPEEFVEALGIGVHSAIGGTVGECVLYVYLYGEGQVCMLGVGMDSAMRQDGNEMGRGMHYT